MGLLDELETSTSRDDALTALTEEVRALRADVRDMQQDQESITRRSDDVQSEYENVVGSLQSVLSAIDGETLKEAKTSLDKAARQVTAGSASEVKRVTAEVERLREQNARVEKHLARVERAHADGLQQIVETAGERMGDVATTEVTRASDRADAVVDRMEAAGERLSQARLWGALATAAYGVMPLLLTLLSVLMVVGGVLHAWEWVVLSDARVWVRAVRGLFTLAGLLAGLYALVRLVLWVRERLERHR